MYSVACNQRKTVGGKPEGIRNREIKSEEIGVAKGEKKKREKKRKNAKTRD